MCSSFFFPAKQFSDSSCFSGSWTGTRKKSVGKTVGLFCSIMNEQGFLLRPSICLDVNRSKPSSLARVLTHFSAPPADSRCHLADLLESFRSAKMSKMFLLSFSFPAVALAMTLSGPLRFQFWICFFRVQKLGNCRETFVAVALQSIDGNKSFRKWRTLQETRNAFREKNYLWRRRC